MLRSIGFLVLVLSASVAMAAEGLKARADGYAEYYVDGTLVVEGQRITADGKTRFEGASSLGAIPLGYEVKVEGRRQRGGAILAAKVEAKPNGSAMYESDVLAATNQLERAWLDAGEMFFQNGRQRQSIGDIVESGSYVERVDAILLRLLPPYISADDVRVHVVNTDQWNASAMGNGSIWVYTGLLDDMTDDEIAIILGHELAHYTHEHSRRGMKKSMWGQIAGVAGAVGVGSMNRGMAREAANLGASLSLSAWQSGYSRELEDQSDRVGLRYAYEAGYDITRGPELWMKFRKKYGEQDAMSNFFAGSHSRPSDRIRNIRRELRRNYPETLKRESSR